MEVLSAFSGCYLEEIKLTVLILSNLATLSEHPFKNKKEDKNTYAQNLYSLHVWT